MANLDDLPIISILNMAPDDAIEHLRQIRLARRTPAAPSRQAAKKKASKAIPKMTAEQAAELLKLMEEL